jgi:beta-N-acetylhexosaminidase
MAGRVIYFRTVEPQLDGESGGLSCNLQCLVRRRWLSMPSCKLRRFLGFYFLPMLLSSAFASHSMGSQTNSKPVPRIAVKENWVTQTLSQLALKEKVGQLVMPAFRAVYLHSNSFEFREIERQLRENHVGGYVLFAGDVYEAAVLIDKVQAASKLPLLIASDFERGANFRIRNTVSFPWNMAIGATDSEDWAYLQGKITGQEARAIGVNWVFAPVLDVNNNPGNPVISIRSYGEDPELVARLGAAFVRGAQEVGVLATGKHFPGHGDTVVDSHLSLPSLDMDRQRLQSLELIPFRKVIDEGIWSIMTAHLAVPALEPDLNVPATLSSRVLNDLLQRELGFSKLIVTDSLTMAGLANGFWTGDAAVRALTAGADVLLDPPDADVVCRAVLDAVERGEISHERIDRSVRKILEAKAWLGLHRQRRVDLNRVSESVNDPKLQEQARRMAAASITLVRDVNGILPIDVRRAPSTHVVLVLGRDSQEETGVFEQEIKRRMEAASFSRIFMGSTDADLEGVLEKVRQAELVICAAFARVVTGSGTVGLPARLSDWMQRLLRVERPVVNVALGDPYVIQGFPQASTYLCTFSNADVSQAAAVKAIFGEIPIKGKLPVSLPGVAALRTGVERQKLEMRLEIPEASNLLRSRLGKVLDALIPQQMDKRVFPGTSIAIGHRGRLVQKSYGKFDYSASSLAVTTETIYDLASLTKVVTATTLAMQLFEDGRLKLEHPVSRFFPSFSTEEKDKVTVRHLLTHSSGLPAHLPLYKELKGKRAFVQRILQLPLESEPGTKAVYSDLGIILLGDILEKVTGKPLDQLAREQIFRPLGMTHSLFNPGGSSRSKIPPTENDPWRGHLLQGEVHDENAYAMGGVSAHAGLFGNSGDLAIFCQMLLNGGIYDHRRIVRRSTVETFTARQNFPQGSSRTLGWDTPSEGSSAGSLLSPSSFGHTGFTGTSIWIDPSRELFIILLTNRVHPTRESQAIQEVRRLLADAVVRIVDEI